MTCVDVSLLASLHALTEVTDFTDDFSNDVDYYVYELGRLRDLVQKEAITVFSQPVDGDTAGWRSLEALAEAVRRFDKDVPKLKSIRNALTHFEDSDRLDAFGSFSAAIEHLPDGNVQFLVDPRYQDHEAALRLSDALNAYLQSMLHSRIASNPAKPLVEQIAMRNARTSMIHGGGAER